MTPIEAAVFARRRRCWANGYRLLEVWSPDQQVNDKGEALNSPGKQPRGRWREAAARNPPEAAQQPPDPRALNTGLLCDGVVAFDVDVLNQDLVDDIVHLIETTLTPTSLVRIGRAPKILLVYRPETSFRKVQTPELFLPDGTKAKVEILAEGQQFVCDGIHPDTGQAYVWTDGSPETVPLGELPVVTEEKAREIIAAAEQLLREAGGKEKEKPQREQLEPEGPYTNGSGGDFFEQVKRAALADIAPWARVLFPRAKFEPGTGAWRVSSKDLGRDLEEDISIHPGGVRDFGDEVPLTPIDLVLSHGGATEPLAAALWLCERLRIEPSTLGYQKTTKPQGAVATVADATWKEPDPDYVRRKLSLAGWLVRDIPTPDRLFGEVISTTSRVLMVAPTGLGKTNLALAIAMAINAGRDFLHWRVTGPRRVLYLDGEMSDRLMKARVLDAVRRNGGTAVENLYILNGADFPDMSPLDTIEGRKFIDCIINALGGVDLIVFDNIQALCSGDMKDEVPWQQTLPWVRGLTQRGIGQLWIHHTGHDETHSYGTKTREWQLDTVILLERIERPEADLAFKLSFSKARERTPDNRADFEPAIITLANDQWSSERGNIQRSGKKPAKDHALELLIDAIARHGTIPPACEYIPPETPCVTEGLWRACCEKGCISEGSPDATRIAFARAAKSLLASGRIGKWELWVWLIH